MALGLNGAIHTFQKKVFIYYSFFCFVFLLFIIISKYVYYRKHLAGGTRADLDLKIDVWREF